MKLNLITHVVALSALTLALSAQAHDPKEHMQDAVKPDCAAMDGMDHSKMDMKDPVMQAMMKKCMKDMDHSKADNSEPKVDAKSDPEKTDEKHSAHQH